MTRRKKKKNQWTSFLSKSVAISVILFLIIGFFTGSVIKFIEQVGGASGEPIFGFTPLRFYLICLFLLVVLLGLLVGSLTNTRDEILERLD